MAYGLGERRRDAIDLAKPTKPPKKVGETTTTTTTDPVNGKKGTAYWINEGGEWKSINEQQYNVRNPDTKNYTALGSPSSNTSLRYPKDAAMTGTSDYVLFEFYEYQPPFQGINKGATKGGSSPLQTYNQSATDSALYNKAEGLKDVILYMPEDVSTGYKANWTGKSFSNIGRDVLSTGGADNVGQFMQGLTTAAGTALDQVVPNAANKTVREVISSITGENIEQNDVFATTKGVILNPNVELLFTGHDLRNFSLNYKLIPRNQPEANNIKEIVNQFRKAVLPSFGNGEYGLGGFNANSAANNFIKVPSVCRVSFMHGSGLNKNVTQYKMCAITQVDVNYTPDGTYATYGDGNMVAIGLSLAFQETKLIFASEVEQY